MSSRHPTPHSASSADTRAAGPHLADEPVAQSESVQQLIAELAEGTPLAEHAQALRTLRRHLSDLLVDHVRPLVAAMPHPSDAVVSQLFDAGGKRLRPVLAMLCAGAVGGEPKDALPVAASVELLHNGTLLHDDVIDEGDVRRGASTARVVWGNALAVLSGDFCYFASLESLLALDDLDVVARSVHVARQMVRGELIQLQRRRRRDSAMDEATYDEVIRLKTAELVAFATWGGARCGSPAQHRHGADAIAAMDRFGLALGMAFQMVDDLLDFTADPHVFGKALGGDLREGVITLPLLYAMEDDDALRREVTRVVASRDDAPHAPQRAADVAAIVARVAQSPGLERARQRVDALTTEALEELECLPPSPYRDSLQLLGSALVARAV